MTENIKDVAMEVAWLSKSGEDIIGFAILESPFYVGEVEPVCEESCVTQAPEGAMMNEALEGVMVSEALEDANVNEAL